MDREIAENAADEAGEAEQAQNAGGIQHDLDESAFPPSWDFDQPVSCLLAGECDPP